MKKYYGQNYSLLYSFFGDTDIIIENYAADTNHNHDIAKRSKLSVYFKKM